MAKKTFVVYVLNRDPPSPSCPLSLFLSFFFSFFRCWFEMPGSWPSPFQFRWTRSPTAIPSNGSKLEKACSRRRFFVRGEIYTVFRGGFWIFLLRGNILKNFWEIRIRKRRCARFLCFFRQNSTIIVIVFPRRSSRFVKSVDWRRRVEWKVALSTVSKTRNLAFNEAMIIEAAGIIDEPGLKLMYIVKSISFVP